VRKAEKNYKHMYSITDVLPCMNILKNTHSIQLSAEDVEACDEDIVKPVGKPFIKKYHHFAYQSVGVLKCKHIKGEGEYVIEKTKQMTGFCSLA
jgi:hypothetical protein